MIRRPPRSTLSSSSAASDVYKRQFLTRPYNSFRITSHQDLITELLLLVVGLAVGELAARGRTHRVAATERSDELALLHSVTEPVSYTHLRAHETVLDLV